MRKLVYFVATSIDGFIAGSDGSTDGFPLNPETLSAIFTEYPETCPAHLRDALGVSGEPRHFDTVLLGARTHEPALQAGLTSAYPHLRQYVVTHRSDLPRDPTVTVVSVDPLTLVRELKQEEGLDIWLCGGGNLAAQLLDEIDEYHVKVNPVLLGSGVPMVEGSATAPLPLGLRSSTTLPGGTLLNVHDAASAG